MGYDIFLPFMNVSVLLTVVFLDGQAQWQVRQHAKDKNNLCRIPYATGCHSDYVPINSDTFIIIALHSTKATVPKPKQQYQKTPPKTPRKRKKNYTAGLFRRVPPAMPNHNAIVSAPLCRRQIEGVNKHCKQLPQKRKLKSLDPKINLNYDDMIRPDANNGA